MTSVKEMESLFELRCLLLHVFLEEENVCTEAMALLQRLFDCVGGKCSEDAFLLMKKEEVAELVEQLENVVIRSLLAQCTLCVRFSRRFVFVRHFAGGPVDRRACAVQSPHYIVAPALHQHSARIWKCGIAVSCGGFVLEVRSEGGRLPVP